jgi:hypothetical protein
MTGLGYLIASDLARFVAGADCAPALRPCSPR